MFFYIHTSFVRISLVCDVGINTLKSIFDDIALIDVDIGGVIELDEMYIKSGLKGKHYSEEIKKLGREPRKRGLKRHKRGRGTYDEDLCPLLTIIDRRGNFILVPIKKASTSEIKPDLLIIVIWTLLSIQMNGVVIISLITENMLTIQIKNIVVEMFI